MRPLTEAATGGGWRTSATNLALARAADCQSLAIRGGISSKPADAAFFQFRGSSFMTSDGGKTWRPLAVTSPEVRIGESGWFVSSLVAYLLVHEAGGRWELQRTRDAGQTWRLVHLWTTR